MPLIAHYSTGAAENAVTKMHGQCLGHVLCNLKACLGIPGQKSGILSKSFSLEDLIRYSLSPIEAPRRASARSSSSDRLQVAMQPRQCFTDCHLQESLSLHPWAAISGGGLHSHSYNTCNPVA